MNEFIIQNINTKIKLNELITQKICRYYILQILL